MPTLLEDRPTEVPQPEIAIDLTQESNSVPAAEAVSKWPTTVDQASSDDWQTWRTLKIESLASKVAAGDATKENELTALRARSNNEWMQTFLKDRTMGSEYFVSRINTEEGPKVVGMAKVSLVKGLPLVPELYVKPFFAEDGGEAVKLQETVIAQVRAKRIGSQAVGQDVKLVE